MFDICQGTGTNYKELKLTRTAAAPQQLVTKLTTFIEIKICVQELKSGLFEINTLLMYSSLLSWAEVIVKKANKEAIFKTKSTRPIYDIIHIFSYDIIQ